MASLSSPYDRFVKVCGYLASDSGGERAAAALKASEILREQGVTWAELLVGVARLADERTPAAAARWRYDQDDWRRIARVCVQGHGYLSDWEVTFVESILDRRQLTPKQHLVLERIGAWLWHKGVL